MLFLTFSAPDSSCNLCSSILYAIKVCSVIQSWFMFLYYNDELHSWYLASINSKYLNNVKYLFKKLNRRPNHNSSFFVKTKTLFPQLQNIFVRFITKLEKNPSKKNTIIFKIYVDHEMWFNFMKVIIAKSYCLKLAPYERIDKYIYDKALKPSCRKIFITHGSSPVSCILYSTLYMIIVFDA